MFLNRLLAVWWMLSSSLSLAENTQSPSVLYILLCNVPRQCWGHL